MRCDVVPLNLEGWLVGLGFAAGCDEAAEWVSVERRALRFLARLDGVGLGEDG